MSSRWTSWGGSLGVCLLAAWPATVQAQDMGAVQSGIGQVVSGWAQQGIVGQALASRVHQLLGVNPGPPGNLSSIGRGLSNALNQGLTTPGNLPVTPPFTPSPSLPGSMGNGIGQIVSEWTHQGIHGRELSSRIHDTLGRGRGPGEQVGGKKPDLGNLPVKPPTNIGGQGQGGRPSILPSRGGGKGKGKG